MIFVGEFILPESIHYVGNHTSYPRVSHQLQGAVFDNMVRNDEGRKT
jgi:hypothetical protein